MQDSFRVKECVWLLYSDTIFPSDHWIKENKHIFDIAISFFSSQRKTAIGDYSPNWTNKKKVDIGLNVYLYFVIKMLKTNSEQYGKREIGLI